MIYRADMNISYVKYVSYHVAFAAAFRSGSNEGLLISTHVKYYLTIASATLSTIFDRFLHFNLTKFAVCSCRVSFRRYKRRQVSILLDFGIRRAGRLELQVGVYTAANLLRSDMTSSSVRISLLKIHLGYLQSTQVLSALDYTKLMCAPSQGRKLKKRVVGVSHCG